MFKYYLPVISPASGSILSVKNTNNILHIVIFLDFFDDHTQYAPITSTIVNKFYKPGSRLPAFLNCAAKNEKMITMFNNFYTGSVAITQIAGTIFRRISSFVNIGNLIDSGEPFGKILFGSRVDVHLFSNNFLLSDEIQAGKHICGGQTILGYFVITLPT